MLEGEKRMKCVNCGSISFIVDKNSDLYRLYDAQICSNCGFVHIFMESTVYRYNEILLRIDELKKQLNVLSLENKKEKIAPFDEQKYINMLEQYKKERDMLIDLGVGGKSLKAKEESIMEVQQILTNHVDSNSKGNIIRFNNRIFELKRELEHLENEKRIYTINK